MRTAMKRKPLPGNVRIWPRCCAVALGWMMLSCGGEEPPPAEIVHRTVKYVEVRSVAGSQERTFTGFSKADIRSQFSFRVSGNLKKIYVEEGDVVQAGDLIAVLESTDFEIKVREVEASLAEARAQLVLSDSEFDRIQGLYERDNASRGEFDSALAQRESAKARVDSVQQQLESAKRQVGYTRLVAPIRCAIIDVLFESGESVAARAPVVEVISGLNPQVEIAVPENLIAELRRGVAAMVDFSVIPDRLFPGRLTTIAVVPTEGLTTYAVTITLDQSWDQLSGSRDAPPIRPGMAVEAHLRFGSGDEASRYMVPAHSVLEDRDGRFVFIVRPQQEEMGIVERREVETGQITPLGLEVFHGLADGERVVVAGLNQIREGQQVRLLAN